MNDGYSRCRYEGILHHGERLSFERSGSGEIELRAKRAQSLRGGTSEIREIGGSGDAEQPDKSAGEPADALKYVRGCHVWGGNEHVSSESPRGNDLESRKGHVRRRKGFTEHPGCIDAAKRRQLRCGFDNIRPRNPRTKTQHESEKNCRQKTHVSFHRLLRRHRSAIGLPAQVLAEERELGESRKNSATFDRYSMKLPRSY